MSRVVFCGLDGKNLGEMNGVLPRGWAMSAGGETKMKLAPRIKDGGKVAYYPEWLNFGVVGVVENPKLPAWGGIVDTDWDAKSPIEITLYDLPYLFHLRSPGTMGSLSGSPGAIMAKYIELANMGGDLGLRAGKLHYSGQTRTEAVDLRNLWEQVSDFLKKTGLEMQIRPVRESSRMVYYVDALPALGVDTGFVLHDGSQANAEIVSAKISGEIWNGVRGIGDEATKGSRMITPLLRDETSIRMWGLRIKNEQFSKVTAQSEMEANAAAFLAAYGKPMVTFEVNALDVKNTFSKLRLGNGIWLHAANVFLPGGVRGWRGKTRIQAMAYDEGANSVAMILKGYL